jgi:hypothetical protein
VRLGGVKYLLEFLLVLDEEGIETLKCWQLGHTIDLLVCLSPLQVAEPVSWVLYNVNCPSGSSQVVAPLLVVHLVAAKEDLDSQNEGEEQLVSLEQTSANVFVEVLSEVVVQVLDALLCLIALRRVVNTLAK